MNMFKTPKNTIIIGVGLLNFILFLYFRCARAASSRFHLLSEEFGDLLLTVVQVSAAVQGGIGHQQEPPLHRSRSEKC